MSRGARVLGAVVGGGLLALPFAALADGLTFNTGGTKALGRGGAVAARPDDPLVLHYDPAGLADLGGAQAMLNVDVPFYTACVEPIGYYGWGVYEPGVSEFGDSGQVAADANGNATPGGYATTPLHEVCNSAPPAPIPQLAFAWRVTDELGVGAGLVGPSAIGRQQFGGRDATISRDGRSWPTPTRYQLVSQRVFFALDPTVGAGYRLLPRLRVGAAFQWLALGVESVQVQAQGAGTSPHNDMLVTARAADYFIPSLTFSVHATPIDALDLTATFQWRDDFDGSGEATYETNNYHVGASSPGVPHENDPLKLSRVHQPLPWVLSVGARFADRTAPRSFDAPPDGAAADPMATERWDVEVDLAYLLNARWSKTSVRVEDTCDTDAAGNRVLEGTTGNLHRDCQRLEFDRVDASGALVRDAIDVPPEGLGEVTVDRHLRDQVAVRLGGSYNLLPNRLAILAGAYYETRGVDPGYASIDGMPFARLGTGLGAVVRVGAFDLMAAYGHVFQETLVVGAPEHEDRDAASAGDPTSGFDKRVGQPCGIGDPACVDPQPLEEKSPPGSPDGTASLEQTSFLESRRARRRVVNAGTYRSDIDVISVGVSYHFE